MEVLVHRGPSRRLAAIAGIAALAILASTAAAVAAPRTKLANQKAGVQTAQGAETGDISGSGKFVVFQTEDDSLSAQDSNGESDIYLANMATGKVALMSVSTSGVNGNNDSWDPVISADGKIVAWDAEATNLVDGKVASNWAVYVKIRRSGKVQMVSVNSAEQPANKRAEDPHLSKNGRFVVFGSDATNLTNKNTGGHDHIYLRDRWKGKTYLISKNNRGKAGNGDSFDAAVSPTGRYVTWVHGRQPERHQRQGLRADLPARSQERQDHHDQPQEATGRQQ